MASIPSQAYLNEDGRSGLLIANILAIVFSGLFFAGRMASRLMKKSHKECSFDASDYNLLAGMILAWTAFALIIYGTTQGLGRHLEAIAMTDPELAGPTRIMQCLIAVECFYLVCLACIKISFLLLFRKVFPGTYFRRITEIVGAIVIAATIVGCFVGIFACRPINAFWDFTPSPTAKCMNIELYMIGNWVHNVVTDLAILCLPQTMIWKLQIDRKSKIALAFTLLLGSFTIIVSVVRFTVLFQLDAKDPTWSLTIVGIWTVIELAAAVASASMPCMRPLMRKIFRESLHSKDPGSSSSRARLGSNSIKELVPFSTRSASMGDEV